VTLSGLSGRQILLGNHPPACISELITQDINVYLTSTSPPPFSPSSLARPSVSAITISCNQHQVAADHLPVASIDTAVVRLRRFVCTRS
jgi:hypothetical protein